MRAQIRCRQDGSCISGSTSGFQVIACARRESDRRQKRFEERVRGAGVNLLADESGLLSQLPGLLDQVLAVE